MARAVEWYTPVDPPDDLRRILACSWTAEPSGVHRLTPDACCDLLRIDGGRFVLCGPEHTSWTFELPPGSTAVGVRFRPGVVHRVFGIDVSSITDRRVTLDEVVGTQRAAAAERAIAAHDGALERRSALVEVVRALVTVDGAVKEPSIEAEWILGAIAAAPTAGQAALSATLGVSVRTLHRLSSRHFGYGTATLSRILRFQRFLSVVSTAEAPRSLAAFAADAGYADQAHLSRDCRAITSLTTQAFLAEYFPTFPDMTDPFKTASAPATNLEP